MERKKKLTTEERTDRAAAATNAGAGAGDGVRLQKYLADCGVASRRHSELLIAEGRVTVNGEVVQAMGLKVHPGRDAVTVDDQPVDPPTAGHVYYLFHKPRGAVVTASDPEDRRTIYDYLEGIEERVVPVGRLDRDSEGLLLLTNDGELAYRLMHPSFGVEKAYEVLVEGVIGEDELAALREGLEIEEGVVTGPATVEVLERNVKPPKGGGPRRPADAEGEDSDPGERPQAHRPGMKRPSRIRLGIIIQEGRKRQIRRMVEAVGAGVLRLKRVREGSLELRNVPYARYRPLTPEEVADLRREVQLTVEEPVTRRPGRGSKR